MLLILAILLFASGCAPYRQAISDDFRDAIKAEVGVGFGLYVDAKATSLVNPGLGWGGYWLNVGLENRHTDFIHNDLNGTPFPIGMIPGVLPKESLLTSIRMANVRLHQRSGTGDDECAIVGQLFDWTAMTKWDAYGVQKRSPHSIFTAHEPSYTEKPLSLELGIGLLLVNARLGFDPVEFIDLFFTVSGFDLLKDNVSVEPSADADAENRATQP